MDEKNLKVFIGPSEIANMGAILADALRQRGIKVTLVSIGLGPFQDGMKYDKVLVPDIYRLNRFQKVFCCIYCWLYCFLKYFSTHNVFIFHFGVTLLPLNLDLPILKLFRKTTVMRFVGDDIRYYKAFEAAAKKAGIKNYMDEKFRRYEQQQASCLKLLQKKLMICMVEKYVTHIISGLSLSQLLTRPYYRIYAQLDIDNIKYNNHSNPMPVVVHAPSVDDAKGTSYILKAVEQLKSEGYDFEFRLFRGVSNIKVRQALSSADIAVDQLFAQCGGMFALEAMAAGCAVLGGNIPEFSGFPKELPIIHTDPDNIYSNLRMLLGDPDLRRELGVKGRRYVERYHDYRKIADDYVRLITTGQSNVTYTPSSASSKE